MAYLVISLVVSLPFLVFLSSYLTCFIPGKDVVGWARIANPTTYMKNNRHWEPEMRIILGIYDEEFGW